jgi:hypothetical protein
VNMAEAFALKRALEDQDFRSGLTQFFAEKTLEAGTQAVQALNQNPCQIEHAIKCSAKAEAAMEGFTLLEEFTHENLTKVA